MIADGILCDILKRTLHNLCHELLAENPELHTCFNSVPMITYENGKTIKNTLVSSKYPAPWLYNTINLHSINNIDELNLENLLGLVFEQYWFCHESSTGLDRDYSVVTLSSQLVWTIVVFNWLYHFYLPLSVSKIVNTIIINSLFKFKKN